MRRLKAQDPASFCSIRFHHNSSVLELRCDDQTNRLTRSSVLELINTLEALAAGPLPASLILTGNENFFSAGADLNEILQLRGPDAFNFVRLGQRLMSALEAFPAPTFAAIRGYCLGGGLDLALACRFRFAAPNAVFGHRGAALGLITGWGGTQRLTRLIGRAQALQMFTAAAKFYAADALRIGLITKIHENPVSLALKAADRVSEMTRETISRDRGLIDNK